MNMQNTNIEIELAAFMPVSDVKKFIVFQHYYEPISLLIDRKVFEQKNATVSLRFDHLGILQSIDRQDILYSKRFEK